MVMVTVIGGAILIAMVLELWLFNLVIGFMQVNRINLKK